MSRRGLSAVGITLPDEDREVLAQRARRAPSARALAMRARIVLACAGGNGQRISEAR